MRTVASVCLCLCLLALAAGTAAAAEVKLGVNAPRGELAAMSQWSELGKYLGAATGQTLTIVPLKVGDLVATVSTDGIDYVIANPTQGVSLIETRKATSLLTLDNKTGSQFAGVILAKKGSGIATAADLKGRKVMSLDASSAGAYLFQAYHLHQKGITLKDVNHMVAKKQDDGLLAVKNGVADACFVRTGILESMVKEGKVAMDDFVVVDARQDPGFSYVHSTVLYPEWFLFAMPSADAALTAKVKAALLALKPDNPAAQAADIKGFIEPLSLDGYVAAMKALGLPPFK